MTNTSKNISAFKFLKSEYAKSMLESGKVCITEISDFRKAKYEGTTYDAGEGKVTLNLQNGVETIDVSRLDGIADAFVFCCTRSFYSESLEWAITERKTEKENDSCLLITDVEEFARRVSSAIQDLKYENSKECRYTGRELDIANTEHHSIIDDIQGNPLEAAFVKPKKYEKQDEFRMLWTTKNGKLKNGNNQIKLDAGVQDLLIKVEFDVDEMKALIKNKSHKVGTEMLDENGNAKAGFFVKKEPIGAFRPNVRRHNGRLLLSFMPPANNKQDIGNIKNFSGIDFVGPEVEIGIHCTDSGVLFCETPLNDVSKIRFRSNVSQISDGIAA